jgi:hypothetical protein
MRGSLFITLTSSLSRQRLCRNAKIARSHSEPQAKNLAFPATYEGEILRLSPQDDVATQPLKGEEVCRSTTYRFRFAYALERLAPTFLR